MIYIFRIISLFGYFLLILSLTSCTTATKTAQYESEEINTLILKSVHHTQLSQFDLARLNIEKALNIDNQDLEANNIAGLLYGKIKENALAIHHFSIALSVSKDDPSTLNNYANYLCDSGNKAQAIDLLQRRLLTMTIRNEKLLTLMRGCALYEYQT